MTITTININLLMLMLLTLTFMLFIAMKLQKNSPYILQHPYSLSKTLQAQNLVKFK